MKCSSAGKPCQFPFRLNGQLHWDCVKTNTSKERVCSVEAGIEVQNFTDEDLSTFVSCGECPKCTTSGSIYYGFYMESWDRSYQPIESQQECQLLCQVATNCNFFEYVKSTKECKLKVGHGLKARYPDAVYGAKYCAGKSNGILKYTCCNIPFKTRWISS